MDWNYWSIAVVFIIGVVLAFPLAIGIVVVFAVVVRGLDWLTTRCPGFRHFRRWRRRRVYRSGRVVSRFLAPDVRRDVLVVDASRIDAGVIVARVRTWNVLYAVQGLASAPPFGDAQVVDLAGVWEWSGAQWGGPVPEPAGSPEVVEPSHGLGNQVSPP